MKHNFYTLIYAALLGTICAALLAGVGLFTTHYRRANAEAEQKRNILTVLEVPFDAKASSGELLEVFKNNVRASTLGEMTTYIFFEDGREKAIAVPFAGQGLWAPIRGFLSLEPNIRTIRGIAFSEQEETPGLGGEIVSERFRRQFKKKLIERPGGASGIIITKGREAAAANEVDGITGATMTCKKVEAMINAAIANILKETSGNGQ